MKILAIRGCNLASLAGEFEIDLVDGPLGAAGVFAIIGNTGAGKSTLLDALCVALFDRTPRLTNHSRVVVGRGEEDPGALGAQDVRTLLRRGASSGWAEVDFESGDGRAYRARWSVRRARNRADGTIQTQQVSLTALVDGMQPGERIGGTKTETLDAIHARLGLTFDQFRRSALLAQGEFATFLRADGKDRSELLERMTGTEIYSRLSVAAHARAALAAQRVTGLRTHALAIAVLDDDARRAAETELALAEDARKAARAHHGALEVASRWVAEANRREAALADALARDADAAAALDRAALARDELALRRRAEALRGPFDDVARAERQLALCRAELATARDGSTQADADHAAATDRRDAIVEVHAPVRAARIAAGVVERGPTSHAAEGPVATSRVLADRDTLLADAAWLAARAGLAAEVAAWRELDARFEQHAAHAAQVAGIDRAIASHESSRAGIASHRAQLVTEHQQATARLADAQRKADGFLKRRGPTLDGARKAEDEARARTTEAERLVSIAAGARQAADLRAEIDRQLAELDAAGADDAIARGELEAKQHTHLAIRSERARAVDELRRAAGYDHARAELRDGEHCPLCGATEHPWASRGAFNELIAAADARLAEVVGDIDRATAALATLTARGHQRERERLQREKARATADQSARTLHATWREHLATLGELLLVDDPATPAAEALAAEREAAARARLEAARDTRRQTEAAMKAVADAQAEVQACQANVDHVARQLADAERRLGELDAQLEGKRAEKAGRLERHAELTQEIEAAVARWLAAAPVDLGAPRADHAPRVELAGGARGMRTRIAELASAWRACAERIAVADAALAAATRIAERHVTEAARTVAECRARVVEHERRATTLAAALAEATSTLDEARTRASFTVDELRVLLAAPASRVDELAEQLAALDRARDAAAAVVAERRRLRDDHAATRPPELAALGEVGSVELARAVAEAELAVERADAHVTRLAGALAADADARTRRAQALAEIEAAERGADVDRVLGEVIGSHDGKRFRAFAQSLTLDGLLAVANTHLDELAPRYQLERVPGYDLELQVIDRDLGDEIRSVQSLSGGESFLVSLALALGLSSMSAHDVRVRTLLIDEGFGTLDPATLDTALNVLDELQARGRQVGVISHVPALVERVRAHVKVVQRGGGRSEVIVA